MYGFVKYSSIKILVVLVLIISILIYSTEPSIAQSDDLQSEISTLKQEILDLSMQQKKDINEIKKSIDNNSTTNKNLISSNIATMKNEITTLGNNLNKIISTAQETADLGVNDAKTAQETADLGVNDAKTAQETADLGVNDAKDVLNTLNLRIKHNKKHTEIRMGSERKHYLVLGNDGVISVCEPGPTGRCFIVFKKP